MEDEGFPDRPDDARRDISTTSINLPPAFDRKYDFSRHFDEGYHSLSGSSLSSNRSVEPRLHLSFLLCCSPYLLDKVVPRAFEVSVICLVLSAKGQGAFVGAL